MNNALTRTALLILACTALASRAYAIDAPHNTAATSTDCTQCHIPTNQPTPWDNITLTGDNTKVNLLCSDCHNNPGDSRVTNTKFRSIKTHSAANTGSTYGGGTWTVECITCHNPHYQRQIRGNLTTGYSDTGVTSAPTTSTVLTDSSKDWAPDQWKGWYLVPNRTYPTLFYEISGNTATTITVRAAQSGIALKYAGTAGSSYGIRYGKLVEHTVDPGSGDRAVLFLGPTGTGSFADGNGAADGICQVCHTETKYFTSDGSRLDQGHPAAAGTNCTESCHQHSAGFKANCAICHGAPPVTGTRGGPDGLVLSNGTGSTGSTTAGAHGRHANSLGISCGSCHLHSAGSGTLHNDGTYRIKIGFSLFSGASLSGSYDGQTTAAYLSTGPGTSVSRTGTKTCSNIACHGSTMAPNGGTDTTPVWDNPSTASCGSCHGASATNPPTRGSHSKHARTDLLGYAYPCETCHRDPSSDPSLHVNNSSEVIFSGVMASGGSSSGTPAMLDAYGTCTNVYCHSTVQSSPPGSAPVYRTTPAWGSEIWSCGACHDYGASLATGSHGKHMEVAELQECWACHNYTGIDDGCMACHDPDSIEPKRDLHANHAINVSLTPRYGGTYSGTPAPGDAYGNCSTVYCHGATLSGGTSTIPAWGGAVVCGDCHYASFPISVSSPPSARSHMRHAGTLTRQQGMTCTDCHGTNGSGGTAHVNSLIEWQLNTTKAGGSARYRGAVSGTVNNPAPSSSYGQCTTSYCHSNVQPDGGSGAPDQYFSPTWGDSSVATCEACHKAASGDNHGSYSTISSGSHSTHLSYAFTTDRSRVCTICHVWNPSEMLADSCTFLCHARTSSMHANGSIEVAVIRDFNSNGTATYNGTPQPGDGYGSCANNYCHSSGVSVATTTVPPNTSPAWGSPSGLACSACHGNEPGNDGTGRPWYANGDPKANSHRSASHGTIACSACHYATTTTGSSISSRTSHVNAVYDVSPDTSANITFTYTYAATGGSCSSVSCHAGGSTRTWGN